VKKWFKDFGKWLKNFRITILFAVFATFVFIGLAVTILIFQRDPQLAGAYTAVGTLILASVTAFLAFFTFLSVKSGYDREKRDRKERWLNEIIEWAINIINWRSEHKMVFKDIVDTKNIRDTQLRKYAHVIEVKESFVGMRGRNQYICKIALKLGPGLHKAAEKLIKSIEKNISLLDNWQHAIAADIAVVDDGNYANSADTSARQVTKLASKVIEEATEIKAKDIS
jgi:hypothetical protein